MPFTIYVKIKTLGSSQNTDISPVPFILDNRPQTVRELLTALTELGVTQYNAGKEAGQLLSYLTKEEIAAQAARGKISCGLHYGENAFKDQAIQNTLQCFEDGIFRVFAGEEELTALSDTIPWSGDLIFTFIRLTMLSGQPKF